MHLEGILISIIIPAFNAEETVELCLTSIVNQSHSNLEIIIMDDGSSDSTVATVNTFVAINQTVPISLYSQANQGPAKARNEGVLRAKGEFIVFLDSDDHLHPSYIKSCLQKFSEKESLNLVYSGIQNFGREQNTYLFKDFNLSLFLRENVIPVFAMVRRKQVVDLGGFDESLKNHEDWELWIRVLQKFGAEVYQIPEHLYYYRKRSSKDSVTDLSQSNHTIEASFYYIYTKHYSYYLEQGLGMYDLFVKSKYYEKYYNTWYREMFYKIKKKFKRN